VPARCQPFWVERAIDAQGGARLVHQERRQLQEKADDLLGRKVPERLRSSFRRQRRRGPEERFGQTQGCLLPLWQVTLLEAQYGRLRLFAERRTCVADAQSEDAGLGNSVPDPDQLY
jgi:hypothetical protein